MLVFLESYFKSKTQTICQSIVQKQNKNILKKRNWLKGWFLWHWRISKWSYVLRNYQYENQLYRDRDKVIKHSTTPQFTYLLWTDFQNWGWESKVSINRNQEYLQTVFNGSMTVLIEFAPSITEKEIKADASAIPVLSTVPAT